jgi:hypothetical protein
MTKTLRISGLETEGSTVVPARHSDGRFGPGNPGRPRGSRDKASQAVEALLDGEAEALTRKAVDLALAGDTTALRLCLERLCPPRKDTPVQFALPLMHTAADAVQAAGAILTAVVEGDLTPGEGAQVMGLVETFRRTLETSELTDRLANLEEAMRGPV